MFLDSNNNDYASVSSSNSDNASVSEENVNTIISIGSSTFQSANDAYISIKNTSGKSFKPDKLPKIPFFDKSLKKNHKNTDT